MKKQIEIMYANDNCKILRKTEGAFAFDVIANIKEPITVKKGKMVSIPTGVFVNLKDRHIGTLGFIRSGLAFNYGLSLINSTAIVDSDYRGEIILGIWNTGTKCRKYKIQPLERIGQVVFVSSIEEELIEVIELSETERGSSGFGG